MCVALTGTLLLNAPAVHAALVAHYELDGNAQDSVGGFHGNITGAATFVPSPYGGGQALSLAGGQYVDTVATNATASNLGVGGNNPKTVSAWARPEQFNDGAIFDMGSASTGQMFSLRTLTDANRWRAQFWGSPDFDFTAPNSHNNWGWYVLVHDGAIGQAYYNGVLIGQRASTLNTSDARSFEIGRYNGGTTFVGQIDDVKVYTNALSRNDIQAQWRAMGGYVEDFEGYGSQIDTGQWYTSGGMNSTRLRSDRGGQGQYVLSTFDSNAANPPGNVRNVYSVHQDHVTSLTWGTALTVLDDSHVLSFNLSGGSFGINEGSQRSGGVGLTLWDLAANDFVRENNGDVRFVTRSGNSGDFEARTISLEGLTGRIVMPVLYDRQIGGWAWAEIDSLSALPGAVAPVRGVAHEVLLEFGFDEPGDFMGWTGDTSSFVIGNSPNGLLPRHINLSGDFQVGTGFLSSALPGAWDSPTGTLRSPEFTLDGDIIEFYISGGSTDRPNLSFELWVDLDDDGNFTLERTAQHQHDSGEFDYDFWAIRDLRGSLAYLQLFDGNSGTWGHIQVDAIRMVAFAVPEPSTFVLALLAMFALLLRGRRSRNR